MIDDEDAIAWYENQKKQARDVAIQYYMQNMQKGNENNAKDTTSDTETEQPADERC